MEYINRICKQDGTRYHDPGGDVNDPKRYCPICGSRAWYAVDQQGPEDQHPVGAVEIAELLDVKPQTVHMWHYRGLLPEPRWQVSGKPAWRQADVLAWARDTGEARMMPESWEGLNFENPPNKIAALTAALVLAITAPSKEQTEQAVALADELAVGLSPDEIEQAKAAAKEHVDG